jgi:hypothetical protein
LNWTQIKRWAKEQGYTTSRVKIEGDAEYTYEYSWNKGKAYSVRELATDIYNDLTNNKHLAHQKVYQKEIRWIKSEN